MTGSKPQSRELELLVTKIQTALSPDAEVTHDARLMGRASKRERQIDVLVRQRIGQYDMTIVIDCKDHARPIDVKGVETFHGLVADVGAQRGVLVCPSGFTKAAKERAAGLQIDIYSPVDTDPHKWQARATAPCVVDYRSAAIAIGVRVTAPMPFLLPYDFYTSLVVHDESGAELGTTFDRAFANWFEGKYPIESGVYEDQPVFFGVGSTTVDNGYGDQIPVELYASVHVTQRKYYGQVAISKISGFKDEQSGAVITNAFQTLLNADEVEKSWQVFEEESELPLSPLMHVTGLVAYRLE